MKVSRKKYLQAINNEDHLTYLDIYMTQAKNMYNKEKIGVIEIKINYLFHQMKVLIKI